MLDVEKIKLSQNNSLESFLSFINTEGYILEFGSGGSTERLSSKLNDRILYSFDSFEGLPEDWHGYNDGNGDCMHRQGSFKSSKPENPPNNVIFVEGWYNESLPKFLKEHTDKVSFVHIDCDLYSSTKTILDCLKPRIQEGTIFVFDEIIGYGGSNEPWKQHEFKAFDEFLTETKYKIEYIGKPHDFGGSFRIIK